MTSLPGSSFIRHQRCIVRHKSTSFTCPVPRPVWSLSSWDPCWWLRPVLMQVSRPSPETIGFPMMILSWIMWHSMRERCPSHLSRLHLIMSFNLRSADASLTFSFLRTTRLKKVTIAIYRDFSVTLGAPGNRVKPSKWCLNGVFMWRQSQNQIGVLLAMSAWCVTEVIRYSYYAMALVGDVAYFLQWTRYVWFAGYVCTLYAYSFKTEYS